jgi:addiction module RelE/StbE family toxin
VRLEWSNASIDDRDEIFSFIEAENRQAAIEMDERIEEQVDRLVQFPESGRPGRIPGTREMAIDRTPYVVAYRLEGTAIRILRVLHGARRWPRRF